MSFEQRGGYGSRGGFGGRDSSFKSSEPKPVEVGKEYDVTVSEISRRGDGIAKIDGFVIFVTGGKQGQSVRIRVTQVSNRFAMGTVVEGAGTPAATTATGPLDKAELAEEMDELDE